jgi:hypothetical protein
MSKSAAPKKTGKKQVNPAFEAQKFKPGQSGNPKGRPKGSRNKLSEAFLSDAMDAWTENGKAALKEMATDKPADFAKMIAGLVPKEMEVSGNLDHTINRIERAFVDTETPER